MPTSSPRTKSTTPSGTEFSGREPLPFALQLNPSDRVLWLAQRLEAYRDSTVHYSASLIRNRGGKQTVAEAEAQAVLETDGFTKLVPIEMAIYPAILAAPPPTEQLEVPLA